ncbi:MAG: hypothetical protein Q7R47_02575 [Candidatus Diapherotrites archaeon]|nr:hypothetical protein [Candidatus Diapherotrites archaeon]
MTRRYRTKPRTGTRTWAVVEKPIASDSEIGKLLQTPVDAHSLRQMRYIMRHVGFAVPKRNEFSLLDSRTGEPKRPADRIRKHILHNPQESNPSIAKKLGVQLQNVERVRQHMVRQGFAVGYYKSQNATPMDPDTMIPLRTRDRIRRALYHNPTVRQMALAKELRVKPPNVSGVRKQMIQEGYPFPTYQRGRPKGKKRIKELR